MNFPYGYKPESISIDDPGSRRVILVVSRGEPERIFYESKYREFKKSIIIGNTLRQGLCIVENCLELYDRNIQEFLKPLNNSGLLDAGNILIQSKYNTSEYFNFSQEQIEEKVILEKWRHYTTVSKYLGAKTVTLKNQEEKETSSNQNFIINISSSVVNLGNNNNFFVKKMEKKMYELFAEYPGSTPNINEAENYIKRVGLMEDQDIKFLINNRAGGNSITKFDQELNLFTKIENGFDLAASIVIPQYLVAGKAKVIQRNNMIKKFITKVNLTF